MADLEDILLFALVGGAAGAAIGVVLEREAAASSSPLSQGSSSSIPSSQTPAPPAPAPAGPLVLLIGDSHASGLSNFWQAQGAKYNNPVASRYKVGSGAVHWGAQIEGLVSALKPGVVVVSCGGNDYHTRTVAVQASIEKIVRTVRQSGAQIVWMESPELPFDDTAGIVAGWLAALATWGGYHFDGKNRNLPHGPDKIHLTAAGYQQLAEQLWSSMSDLGVLK